MITVKEDSVMNEMQKKKNQFWAGFFISLVLSLSIWLSMGFILAFNPQIKKVESWKFFMWFAGHFAWTQWFYIAPLILIIYACKGINISKGIAAAGLVMSLLLLGLQLH